MANRKATFAKRQRETELKDRAKAKGDRRAQKRVEVRPDKGPQIAWDEAVRAVVTDENADDGDATNTNNDGELPSLRTGNQETPRVESAPEGNNTNNTINANANDNRPPAAPSAPASTQPTQPPRR